LVFERDLKPDIQAFKALLEQFERDIRKFLEILLSKHYKDWWNEGIPPEISARAYEKLEKRKQEDNKLGIIKEIYHKIEFLDFANYHDIIFERKNYNDIFSVFFPEKNYLHTYFKELSLIRNDLAHPRDVSPERALVCKHYIARIYNLIRGALYERKNDTDAGSQNN
jgi:hypothetical protein